MAKILGNHRLLGVAFIGLLILGVWLVNAVFTQKFVDFENVNLKANNIGLQMPKQADVKVRGVIVGQVNKIETEGDGAVLQLGLKPEKIKDIPSNVSAAILPKTLFGEKYVELQIPQDASSSSLKAGDTIEQTKLPIEVEKVLNDLYPLLRTVQPAELNYTLNAFADALEGRGDKLGEGLETLDGYLKKMNPQLPALIADIKLLAQVTDLYADVTPALAATLRNTVKTGNTLRSKEEKLQAFLNDLTAFSDTTTAFLNESGDNIIRLGELGEPILALLARYSPGTECLLKGIVRQAPRLGDTFRDFIFHIDLKVLPHQPRGYNAGDKQVYGADNGPVCAGLPNPPIPYYPALGDLPDVNDGVNDQSLGKNGRALTGFGASGALPRLSAGPGGTQQQKALVNSLTAPVLGVPAADMSDVATLLFVPVMAGTEVSVR